MKPLNLNDTERMARVGRLTVLKSERRKSAEKLRDAMVVLINGTNQRTDYEAITQLVSDMKELDELIAKEEI
jgi:hypothetical protein